MTYPTQDTAHVAEGLNYLIGIYRDKPGTRGLLTAFLNRIQDIENMLWSVIECHLLTTPPSGIQLDEIGDLLGEPRGGFTDAQYLPFIQVAIAVRRSGGRSEELIGIMDLVLTGSNYQDFFPAAFEIWALNMPTDAYAVPLGIALRKARAAGVGGVFNWSNWSTATQFYLGDSVVPTLGSGLKDSVSSANARGLLSGIQT